MKWGNTAKIDHLMSPARDCGTDGNGASYRYLLCSTARCGSNLVSDMLQQTGLAGDPMVRMFREVIGMQFERT